MGEKAEWWAANWPNLVRLVAVGVFTAVFAHAVWPGESLLPGTTVPSALFNDVLILGLSRSVLLLALAYLALSILAHAWRGTWLKGVGPTSTEPLTESVDELREQAIRDRRELREARKTIDDLTARLEECERARANMESSSRGQETKP